MKLEMILITVTGKLIIRAIDPRDGKANVSHTCVCQHFGCSWLVMIDSSLKAVMNMLGYWKVCGHCASLFDLLVAPSHK